MLCFSPPGAMPQVRVRRQFALGSLPWSVRQRGVISGLTLGSHRSSGLGCSLSLDGLLDRRCGKSGHALELHVAMLKLPLIVLLEEHRAEQAGDAVLLGEDVDNAEKFRTAEAGRGWADLVSGGFLRVVFTNSSNCVSDFLTYSVSEPPGRARVVRYLTPVRLGRSMGGSN